MNMKTEGEPCIIAIVFAAIVVLACLAAIAAGFVTAADKESEYQAAQLDRHLTIEQRAEIVARGGMR